MGAAYFLFKCIGCGWSGVLFHNNHRCPACGSRPLERIKKVAPIESPTAYPPSPVTELTGQDVARLANELDNLTKSVRGYLTSNGYTPSYQLGMFLGAAEATAAEYKKRLA